ncbi:MAG: GIY-YIG nuclease family protein [Bacteroidia bacterium]|nr:GIY-YIG nuclease family protein [Bacteroidia bacterium]
MDKHFVYIIYSEKFDKYYVGQTNDFDSRLMRHNSGYEGFTKPFRPWEKILVLEKNNRAEAMDLERKLKNLSKRLLD